MEYLFDCKVPEEFKYCIPLALLPEQEGMFRAVGGRNTYWPNGKVLKIGFIGGTQAQIDFVKVTLNKSNPQSWLYHANLSVSYPQSGPYDIRISFVLGGGSWSYIGTDCSLVPQQYATMNIGWGPTTQVVLHEFGHAIGQLHEQQNPDRALCWNRANVIADLSGSPNNWTLDMIEHNVLTPYQLSTVYTSAFDPLSIMEYNLPARWLCDNIAIAGGSQLSAGDIAFIKLRYPQPTLPIDPLNICLTPTQVLELRAIMAEVQTAQANTTIKLKKYTDKLTELKL